LLETWSSATRRRRHRTSRTELGNSTQRKKGGAGATMQGQVWAEAAACKGGVGRVDDAKDR
jgi:hypothetical protein